MTKRHILLLLFCTVLSACSSLQATAIQTATPLREAESLAWWHEAVFYEIFVRSFYDTDGDGIGDFNGITQKLDYLSDLGITAIWLMPIHPSPSYHGYDVLDFKSVNPEYGTIEDFKQLLNEAHKRDIRIIIDLVLNHTSSQHPFFVDADNNLESPYRDWYIWAETPQGDYWHEGKHGYYYGYFWSGMPDLNYTNPEVTKHMENVVDFWLDEIGVDGFRIDAAKHLIEEDGKIENTQSTHDWYKGFYKFYKTINPDAYTVGEAFGAGAFIAKTYESQFDHIFNFELASGFLSSARTGTNTPVNSAIKFSLQDDPDFNFATFLTNHDQDRVMSVLDRDIEKAKVAAFLLLTSPGTPFLYYGEEIGMQGRKPDEDIRLPMQWDSDTNAGFTTGIPWRPPDRDYKEVNIALQEDDPNSLLSFYRNLISLRNQHPALQSGSLSLLDTGNSGLYAVLRANESEILLALVNLTDQSISDYRLTLTDAGITPGSYSLSPLFGEENFAGFQTSSDGHFQDWKPLEVIQPYRMYILKLSEFR